MSKSFSRQFYNSKAWKSVRAFVLNRDHYTCCDCEARAEEVHHLVSLDPSNIDDPMIALNPDNLCSLCKICHTKRTQKATDVEEGYEFDADGYVVLSKGRKE